MNARTEFNLDVRYDDKRQGYFVNGDGFDFFAYFVGSEKNCGIECDYVERKDYGEGFATRIYIPAKESPLSEETFKAELNKILMQQTAFFIPNTEPDLINYRSKQAFFFSATRSIVKLCALSDSEEVLFYATGFLVKEGTDIFLYTCWHVLAGIDFLNLNVTADHWPPKRKKLSILFPKIETKFGVTSHGQKQITVPLYQETESGKLIPVWMQELEDQPHEDLNAVGLKIPLEHDFAKILITDHFSDEEKLNLPFFQEEIASPNPRIGDTLLIGGYPYGFSVFGSQNPQPVYLSRKVASEIYLSPSSHGINLLLDGGGFQGMSGAPVFLQRNEEFHLMGIYTGRIFPDAELIRKSLQNDKPKNDLHAALGLVSFLYLCRGAFNEATEL